MLHAAACYPIRLMVSLDPRSEANPTAAGFIWPLGSGSLHDSRPTDRPTERRIPLLERGQLKFVCVGWGWGPPAAHKTPSSKGRRPAVQKTPCNKGILFTRTPGPPLAIASLPSGQYAFQNAEHPPKTCSPTDAFNYEPPFRTSTKPAPLASLSTRTSRLLTT